MKQIHSFLLVAFAFLILIGIISGVIEARPENQIFSVAKVTVVVTDNNQTPVPNALVTATSSDGIYSYSGETDNTGTVVLSDSLFTSVRPGQPSEEVPEAFALFPNYPNPFNSATNIEFALRKNSEIKIEIRNIRGQLVNTLYRGQLAAGQYQIVWDGKSHTGIDVAAGIYLFRVFGETATGKPFSLTGKMAKIGKGISAISTSNKVTANAPFNLNKSQPHFEHASALLYTFRIDTTAANHSFQPQQFTPISIAGDTTMYFSVALLDSISPYVVSSNITETNMPLTGTFELEFNEEVELTDVQLIRLANGVSVETGDPIINGQNVTITYDTEFLNPKEAYKLIINGRDKAGNEIQNGEYVVDFTTGRLFVDSQISMDEAGTKTVPLSQFLTRTDLEGIIFYATTDDTAKLKAQITAGNDSVKVTASDPQYNNTQGPVSIIVGGSRNGENLNDESRSPADVRPIGDLIIEAILNNRDYSIIAGDNVSVLSYPSGQLLAQGVSDNNGQLIIQLDYTGKIRLVYQKNGYYDRETQPFKYTNADTVFKEARLDENFPMKRLNEIARGAYAIEAPGDVNRWKVKPKAIIINTNPLNSGGVQFDSTDAYEAAKAFWEQSIIPATQTFLDPDGFFTDVPFEYRNLAIPNWQNPAAYDNLVVISFDETIPFSMARYTSVDTEGYVSGALIWILPNLNKNSDPLFEEGIGHELSSIIIRTERNTREEGSVWSANAGTIPEQMSPIDREIPRIIYIRPTNYLSQDMNK